MKRYFYSLLLCYFFSFFISCASSALKEFTLPENADMLPSEKWRFSLYVDEYGISTDQPYISQKTKGMFTNIATRGDECEVTMFVDKDSMFFKIYEYGSYLASGSGPSDEYFLTIDDEIKAKAWNGKNYFYVSSGAQDIVNKLAEGKICNFRLTGGEYTTRTYFFHIDGKGFANWLTDVIKYSP